MVSFAKQLKGTCTGKHYIWIPKAWLRVFVFSINPAIRNPLQTTKQNTFMESRLLSPPNKSWL